MQGVRVPIRRLRRMTRRGSMVAVLGSMLGLALGATPGLAADSGGVDAQVTVSPAAACIELSTASVDFGTLALGAENQAGAPGITITNCGDADASLMASGTNAFGQGATWNLVDSSATCADTLGLDNYHLALADTTGTPIATLSSENKELGTLLAAGSTDQVARISTACPGSSGAGKVMSMSINYVATTIVAPPIVLESLTADDPTAASAAAFVQALAESYRYLLETRRRQLVTLDEEFALLDKYLTLTSTRYPGALIVEAHVTPPERSRWLLPPVSLPELLENAVKHNVLTPEQPLRLTVRIEKDCLIVANTLRPRGTVASSTGVGLPNMADRFRLTVGRRVTWGPERHEFIVRLPLKEAL